MPIYEHECECGHRVMEFSKLVDWDSNPICLI